MCCQTSLTDKIIFLYCGFPQVFQPSAGFRGGIVESTRVLITAQEVNAPIIDQHSGVELPCFGVEYALGKDVATDNIQDKIRMAFHLLC